jgi:hypothetical protein
MTKIKIFISYCSEDTNKMRALKRAIEKCSFLMPVVVADNRSPKQSLAEKVKRAIHDSDYLVSILTKDSIRNQWVNQEIGFAEALENKIRTCPIVEASIAKQLKGFIHNNIELCTFMHSTNKEKESEHFRSCCKLLLKYIANFEEIDEEPSVKDALVRVENSFYDAKDAQVRSPITDRTNFHLIVKLPKPSLNFVAYYLFETDQGEQKWVGYKNDNRKDYIKDNEYTKTIANTSSQECRISENVMRTINERFPGLVGHPLRIVSFRFRGDRTSKDLLRFYYAFTG